MGRPYVLTENTKKHLGHAERQHRLESERKAGSFDPLNSDNLDFLDKTAMEEFEYLKGALKGLPITNLDKGQLAQYCSFYSDFMKATRRVNREGTVVKDAKGGTKLNPAFNAKEKASSRMTQIANSLGLTVDSRMKIILPNKEVEQDDVFKDF